ncbi:MAG TPA: hypothetical protein VF752_07115 [Thermoleophilaceae bacterium]
MPRYRLLGLAAAVAVFAAALIGAWVVFTPSGSGERVLEKHRVYFAYQNTPLRASVETRWNRERASGALASPDGLGLRSRCVEASMFSYLSRNWREGPVKAAAMILTGTFAEQSLYNVRAVTRTATSALVVDPPLSAITLVRRSGTRDYTALVAQFTQQPGCSSSEVSSGLKELRRVVDSFRVGA